MTAPNMTTQGFGWSLDQSVTANAMSITLTNPPAAVVNQALVGVVPADANTGAVTLTITNAPAPWSSANAVYFQGSPLVAGMFNAGDLLTVAWNDPAARWDAHINPLMLNKYVFSGADGLGDNAITESASSFTLAVAQSGQQVIVTSAGAAVTLPPPTIGLNYDLWMTGGSITAPSGLIVNEWQSAASFSIPTGNVQHVRLVCDGTNWRINYADLVISTAVTFNVGGSSPNFSTMMAAIEWIRQLTVLDGGSVTLYECRSSVTEQYAITGLYAPWLTITTNVSGGVDLPFATSGYVVLPAGAYIEGGTSGTYQFSFIDCVLNLGGSWVYNTTTLSRSMIGQLRGDLTVLSGSSFTINDNTNSSADCYGGRMFFDGSIVATDATVTANGPTAFAGSDVTVGANAVIQAYKPLVAKGGRATCVGGTLEAIVEYVEATNAGIMQLEKGSISCFSGASSNNGIMQAINGGAILVGSGFSISSWSGVTGDALVASAGGIIEWSGSFPAPVAGMTLAQAGYGGRINIGVTAYSGPAAAAYAAQVSNGGFVSFAVDPTATWTDGFNVAPNSITSSGLITAPSAGNTPITSAYAATATPLMDGAAAVGTSLDYARQDHVHPTDTSRAALWQVGNFGGYDSYNASATLTGSQAGHFIAYYGSTTGQTLTMPDAKAGTDEPWTFTLSNISSASVTLALPTGNQFTLSNGTAPTSIVLASGETLVLVAGQNTGNWSVIGGSGAYDANGAPLYVSQAATQPTQAVQLQQLTNSTLQPGFYNALTLTPPSNQTGLRAASDATGVYLEANPAGTGANAFWVSGLGGVTLTSYNVKATSFTMSGYFSPGVYTVANLPTGVPTGARATVSDATSPTFLGSLTGGGTVTCPVFYNGSAWVAG